MPKTHHELLSTVLSRLESITGKRPRKKGDGYIARCPAHDDHTPSLSVEAGKKGVLLNCHAACTIDQIVSALGMDKSDLFYDSGEGSARRSAEPSLKQWCNIRQFSQSAAERGNVYFQKNESRDFGEVFITMYDADGAITGARKRRSDTLPYQTKDGDAKALTAYHPQADNNRRSNGLFLSKGVTDSDGPVLFVEGGTDFVAALTGGAENVAGTPGANPGKKVRKYAVKLFAERDVTLCPDPDEAGQNWKDRFAKRFYHNGSTVRIVHLADGDLDDTLSAADDPAAELQDLIDSATTWEPETEQPVEATSGNIAQKFIRWTEEPNTRAAVVDGRRHFRFHRDQFYEWTGTRDAPIRTGDLEARISRFVDSRDWVLRNGDIGPRTPSRAQVRNVTGNLRGHGLVPGYIDPPVWLDTMEPAKRVVALKNCIVDLEASFKKFHQGGEGDDVPMPRDFMETHDHSPNLFTTTCLNYDYAPNASMTRWMQFLNEVLPGEDEQRLLAQWAGYLLIPTQGMQKILCLVGEGGNGKSVVMDVCRMLIGPENCSSVPLEQLHLPHALQPMTGKLCNFATEWGYLDQVGLDTIKKISGGDHVTINPKYRDPFEAWLPTRFMVSTNETPDLRDRSEAIWRRLMVLPFEVEIPEEDQIPKPKLLERMRKELPGIFLWAVTGLFDLWESGQFTVTEDMQDAASDVREASNPAAAWCDASLEITPSTRLVIDNAYADYKAWCNDGNYKPLNKGNFSKEIRRWYKRQTGEKPDSKRPRIDGKQKTALRGIHMMGGDQ